MMSATTMMPMTTFLFMATPPQVGRLNVNIGPEVRFFNQ